MWDHFFPLLFPKDSESLKILDIRLREVGAKRPLNRRTDRHTDTRTDISNYRKHRPRGPMLWKQEIGIGCLGFVTITEENLKRESCCLREVLNKLGWLDLCIRYQKLGKLDEVALLVTDPPCANSTILHSQPSLSINISIYLTVKV